MVIYKIIIVKVDDFGEFLNSCFCLLISVVILE